MTTTTTLGGLTALVTGATAGIGRAVALQLGQLGVEVLIHGRSAERGAVDVLRNNPIADRCERSHSPRRLRALAC